MKAQHVIVLGAAGNIGQFVVAVLERMRIPVVSVDRVPQVGGYCLDVTSESGYSGLRDLWSGPGQTVINAAGVLREDGPLGSANVDVPNALTRLILKEGGHVVHCSSINVTLGERALTSYTKSKIAAEALLRGANIPSTLSRIPDVVGRGSIWDALPRALLHEGPLILPSWDLPFFPIRPQEVALRLVESAVAGAPSSWNVVNWDEVQCVDLKDHLCELFGQDSVRRASPAAFAAIAPKWMRLAITELSLRISAGEG